MNFLIIIISKERRDMKEYIAYYYIYIKHNTVKLVNSLEVKRG